MLWLALSVQHNAALAHVHWVQIEPSGKRFLLEEEKVRVKVEDGKIQRMEVLPTKGAGPLALYRALGGTVPAKQAASV